MPYVFPEMSNIFPDMSNIFQKMSDIFYNKSVISVRIKTFLKKQDLIFIILTIYRA